MNMAAIKNKIPEVLAYARMVVRKYGHTRKYAKHIVASVVKQVLKLTDKELAEFLSTSEIGRLLGYKTHFNHTIFSKVRKDAEVIMSEIYEAMILDKMRGRQVRLIAIDSTDIPAFSSNDTDAKFGHRTPSKREQRTLKDKTKTMFFGYKLHGFADAELEVPITVEIAPANRHDKKFFHRLYQRTKELFRINMNPNAKVLADSAYDATDVYQELHYDNVKPVIATNGRGYYKSSVPKDKDYAKRWSIERVFSRLKEVFGMSKNRFIGISKVAVHVYSCLIAYLVKYL